MPSRSEDAAILTIHAGPHARTHTVIRVPRPTALSGPELSFEPEGGGEPWAAQIDRADPETLWLLVPGLAAGAEVRLRPVPHAAPRPGVALTEENDTIEVWVGGELFTAYHYGAALARPYLYPVVGPKGARVTRECRWEDGPGFDHKHHKSVWIAHGLVNGTDNWSEEPGHGSTRHTGFDEVTDGPVMGRIVETTEWLSASGRKVLDETRVLRFYAQPAECRCLDVEITFRTGHDAVLFG
ncbi:MAG TPA: PmoA family protein, partial [Armatimonadota bacterium]|nr:PmoA family protein [Armatimonadota bacterium]